MSISEGAGNISAEIIAHSINTFGDELITMKLHYPRFIHSEFMTHRMFSRNASSSRAIPVSKVIDQVMENPAMPIHWGKNQAGMQAHGEVTDMAKEGAKELWISSAKEAARNAKILSDIGVHKQVVNRILEPYQFMNVIVSATNYNNFFWLRDHEDAQPEIRELAIQMKNAIKKSKPELLYEGEYHTPYVEHERVNDILNYYVNGNEVDEMDAIKVSASCCAQVSYRLLDNSLEKAINIFDRLVTSEPIHASPFEHIATPIETNEWSGNFKGWKQFRKTLKNEALS
jgi:thymidylate synthase ThyX